MLRGSCRLLTLFLALAVCSIVITGSEAPAQQSQSANSTPSRPPSPVYLPSQAGDSSLLSMILYYLDEPSLLEAAKDPNAVSFRASYFAPQPGYEAVVRLTVNANGSGEMAAAVSSGAQLGIKFDRTKNEVSAADVDKFLQFLEKSGFWTTGNTNAAEAARNKYVLDGAWWMLEGVRNGSFHYVFHRNPEPDRITEIGCYMAKNLVTSDSPQIRMPGCRQPNKRVLGNTRDFRGESSRDAHSGLFLCQHHHKSRHFLRLHRGAVHHYGVFRADQW